MPRDNRIKACSNTKCIRNHEKYRYKATEQFCSVCGSKLVFVCSKCFRRIEDLDSKHKICATCEAESDDKKEKMLNNAAKVASVIIVPAIGYLSKNAKSIVKGGFDIIRKFK